MHEKLSKFGNNIFKQALFSNYIYFFLQMELKLAIFCGTENNVLDPDEVVHFVTHDSFVFSLFTLFIIDKVGCCG